MSSIKIISFSWGKVVTCYKNQSPDIWKDCVIAGDSVSEWNWNCDGTRHRPGITVRAYKAIEHCNTVILSTGIDNVLQITPELKELLEGRPNTYILNSTKAAKKYTELLYAGETDIGMLLHSTC